QAATSRSYAEQVIGARRRSSAQKHRKSASSCVQSFIDPPSGRPRAAAPRSATAVRLTGLLPRSPARAGLLHSATGSGGETAAAVRADAPLRVDGRPPP